MKEELSKLLEQIREIDKYDQLDSKNPYASYAVFSHNAEFQAWRSELRTELQALYGTTHNQLVKDVITLLDTKFNGGPEGEALLEVGAKLRQIIKDLN